MKYSLLLFFLLPTLCVPLAAQTKVLFEDHFEDNRFNWDLSATDKKSAEIRDGLLIVNTKTKASGTFFTQTVPVPEGADMDISLSLTQRSGPENMGFGLCWGLREGEKDFYALLISTNGKYTILRMRRGKFSELKRWTLSRFIEPKGKPNLITVRKRGDVLHFYINNQPIFSGPWEPVRGGRMGLVVYGTMKIETDFLSIRIPPPATPQPRADEPKEKE
ncbi:MAG: hypothetical protein EAZ89_00980 [Bacteroidetes bacterium]|nr:MAG: hypothetical protein EAZ89_00980 [Bacteroidota bacterium]